MQAIQEVQRTMYTVFWSGSNRQRAPTRFNGSNEEKQASALLLDSAREAVSLKNIGFIAVTPSTLQTAGTADAAGELLENTGGGKEPSTCDHVEMPDSIQSLAEENEWQKRHGVRHCSCCYAQVLESEQHVCCGKHSRHQMRGLSVFSGIGGICSAMKEVNPSCLVYHSFEFVAFESLL
jgi:hypothetical protein